MRLAICRTDVVLALVLAALQPIGVALVAGHQSSSRHLDALGYLLMVASGLVLVTRRGYPVATFAAAFVSTMAFVLIGYPGGPFWLPLIITFGTLVLRGRRLIAYAGLVAGYLVAIWLTKLIHDQAVDGWQSWGIAAWLFALLLISEVIRSRRAFVNASRQQAVDEQRRAAEQARREASEDRLRIARDLHDVLAHSISLINVQAGVALELMDERPEQARTALAAIKQTSRDALVDVHSVLGQLREPDEQAPRAPAPSLDDVEELVARAGSAGMTVRTRVVGSSVPLPTPVQSVAYRIVQEALTNVARHAGPVQVDITLSYAPDRLDVEVVNQPGSRTNDASAGSGSGIRGMRERAAVLGGEVSAGPLRDGRFRLLARLPLYLVPQP